jgi:hypothetical protein
MENLHSPVRYEGLTEQDVQAHLRHSASSLKAGDRSEILLCEAGVVIPFVKHVYQRKPATLDVLIRSGSIDRDRLMQLRESLLADGYDLRVSFTSKRKVLSRVVVRLRTDDSTISVTGVNVIRAIALALKISWPCEIAVGYYALGSEVHGLPGRLAYRNPYRNAGYQLGFVVGQLVRKVIS